MFTRSERRRFGLQRFGLCLAEPSWSFDPDMVTCFRVLIVLALLATIASTLPVYPHQLAYFNEVAGGPENGDFQLAGSSVDWAQSILQLREWAALNSSCRPLLIALNPTYDVTAIGLTAATHVASDGAIRSSDLLFLDCKPPKAWIAISRNYLHRPEMSHLETDDPRIVSRLNYRPLRSRPANDSVGHAINIYEISCSEGLLVPISRPAKGNMFPR